MQNKRQLKVDKSGTRAHVVQKITSHVVIHEISIRF